MAVNKPNEMLSTPGRYQEHSVYTIIKDTIHCDWPVASFGHVDVRSFADFQG